MNITIKPGAAVTDAAQIDKIVAEMENYMSILNNAFQDTIGSGRIQTNWSENLLGEWNNYYKNEIPNAMAEMKLSSTNLRLAVEAYQAYNK